MPDGVNVCVREIGRGSVCACEWVLGQNPEEKGGGGKKRKCVV